MQTKLPVKFLETPVGQEADNILRSCVHCGFCTATCPTYQLLGDELDGPRGRIYLIKQILESQKASMRSLAHLDRCLTCRNCETTCPSGVHYSRLLEIGRHRAEQLVRRPLWQTLVRKLLLISLPDTQRFRWLIKPAQLLRPLLWGNLKRSIPVVQPQTAWPQQNHSRKMLVLQGCVQPVLAPQINLATARVLNRLGIQLDPFAGCCGAINHHLNDEEQALQRIKQNIDQLWPMLQGDYEAIVMTASGCGAMFKDYKHLLQHDSEYATKAAYIAQHSLDLCEILARENLAAFSKQAPSEKVAFHPPCTLQHAQRLNGVVEEILQRCGFQLVDIKDKHLCCGSAGTYSMLHPRLSRQLATNKVAALRKQQPDLIATANIGCLQHLNQHSPQPVIHWIELLASSLD